MAGLPAASQASRAWPPFQALVVKPRISTLTPQRSSVRARMSAQQAATMIGPPAHAARVVEQQRHDRVAEVGVALVLEGERVQRIDDDAGEPRRVERALLEVEVPGAVLLRHQLALQPVGEPRHRALQVAQLLVEEGPQPLQLVGRGQALGGDLLVVRRG